MEEKEKKKDEPGSYEAVCSADPKLWTFDAAFPMPPGAGVARSSSVDPTSSPVVRLDVAPRT